MGERRVVARQAAVPGEVLLEIAGELSDRPSRYSIQLGKDTHIEPPPMYQQDVSSATYAWQFLNHSCDPNAALEGTHLVAIKPIRAGDEITFDYNTTELEMASPFTCNCTGCGGTLIRGFKFLPESRQHELVHRLAEHLKNWLTDGAC